MIPLSAIAETGFYVELEVGYEEYMQLPYSIVVVGYENGYVNLYTGIETIIRKHENTKLTFYPLLNTYFIGGEINFINRANIITTIGIYHQCSHRSEEGYKERYYWLPTITRYYGRITFRTH